MMNRRQPWLHIFRKPDDEGGAPATPPATPPAPPPPADPGAAPKTPPAAAPDKTPPTPADDWGTWSESLTDAQKKDYAKRFKGREDLLDAALNMRKDLSTRIKVPDDKASAEDVAAFRKAIKASDKVEDYKAAVPQGYQLDEVSTALLGEMQKAAVESGVPTASFERFTKTYFEMEKAVQDKITADVDQYRRDSELKLKQEFGQNYERNVQAAKVFIDQKLNMPEFTHLLEDTIKWKGVDIQLGSHPAVMKMLAQIGLRTAEDGVIGHTTVDERQSIQSQITALRAAHPFGTSKYTPDVDRQITELTKRLHG